MTVLKVVSVEAKVERKNAREQFEDTVIESVNAFYVASMALEMAQAHAEYNEALYGKLEDLQDEVNDAKMRLYGAIETLIAYDRTKKDSA